VSSGKPSLLLYYPPGYGLDQFAKAFAAGKRSEQSHWSMHLAELHGFRVVSTQDFPSPRLGGLIRKLTYWFFWFDLPHLLANWRAVREADLIWAMSEREMVPALVAANAGFAGGKNRPAVFGEIIWLLDEWPAYAGIRRSAWRRLMARAGGIIAMTHRCMLGALEILPKVPAAEYRLGLPIESFANVRSAIGPNPDLASGRPLRILAMGNDRRRDWSTLAAAFGGDPRFELIVATGMAEELLAPLRAHPDITIDRAADFAKVRQHLAWADLLVMPVLPNEHGAGLTTLLEAAACGLPILCMRVGGIDEYFSDEAVTYVAGANPSAMRDAALAVIARPDLSAARAARARTELDERGYDSTTAVAARCAIMRRLAESLRERA
jgi:glycosyltransferase involved in cell wall biosynthesis